jgi:hypothetical protein
MKKQLLKVIALTAVLFASGQVFAQRYMQEIFSSYT